MWTRSNPPSLYIPSLLHFLTFYSVFDILSFTFSFSRFLLILSVFLLFYPFPFCQETPTLFLGQMA